MKIPVITGPTASGKTSSAFDVAERFGNVEIISADAFQVYRGLDIGTAKASLKEREKYPHHLIDIMEHSESYTAGLFCEQAEKLVDEIIARGNTPMIVGGTGLYIKTLTHGIFDCPEIDKNIRTTLLERVESEGLDTLYSELLTLDVEYANKISKSDPARIIRALEVSIGLGLPFSEAHRKYHKAPKFEYEVFVFNRDRQDLYNDINSRTAEMFEGGWVDEVDSLLSQGVDVSCPAFRAIGYKAIANYIISGGDKQQVIDRIAKETRNFAKRQMTWFRGVGDVRFYDDKKILVEDVIKLYNV